jgi:CheY-like chemotaxis protein
MSHELRTPLNAIIGMSELLAEAPDAPAHRRLPDSIRRAGKALLALISDVLDLSQIEAGKIALRHAAFAPRRLVDEVMDIFGPEAAAKSLRLQVECSPDVPAQFVADPARLRQILVNLVGNAVKFTPSGEVRIEMHCVGDDSARTLWIDVVDSGLGVRESDRERIFNAFQQLDATASRAHAGSGLGLKISRDLAQLMGGTLDVVAAHGGGSRFRLRIPQAAVQTSARAETGLGLGAARRDDATAATSAAPVVVAVAEGSPTSSPQEASVPSQSAQQSAPHRPVPALRVLVVEDNSVNSALIKLMLERFGCTVDCIANGVQALAAMHGGTWDIVLMDCQMPQLDGYETTRRWRTIEAEDGRARLPIVALTAHAMTGDREKCLAAGMDDYLTKPIVLDDLRVLLLRHGREAATPTLEAIAP